MEWRTACGALAITTLVAAASAGPRAATAPAAGTEGTDLSGAWELNRDLSSAPGGGWAGPDGGGRGGRPHGGGGRGAGGGGGRGGFGGGFGGRGGPGGGGRPEGERPSREDTEARRALMQEILELPARFTIAQDGEKVVFIEPDGVVRTYLANGKSERHQLTNGTIETTTSWSGATLQMRIAVGARGVVLRTFERRDDPRRLEVATGPEHGAKDARRMTVYDDAGR